jgi:hypothetical protein
MKDIADIIYDAVKDISTITRPVYFTLGNWVELCSDLAENSKSKTYESQRYPLILLNSDYTEKVDIASKQARVSSIKLYIITQSKGIYSTDERRAQIYKTILIPIYNDFLKRLKTGRYIKKVNDTLQHDVKNLYRLWVGDKSNKLPDDLDAIELTFNDLVYNLKKC